MGILSIHKRIVARELLILWGCIIIGIGFSQIHWARDAMDNMSWFIKILFPYLFIQIMRSIIWALNILISS
jgi:hypothetical protein